jgi:hypothetical protein
MIITEIAINSIFKENKYCKTTFQPFISKKYGEYQIIYGIVTSMVSLLSSSLTLKP